MAVGLLEHHLAFKVRLAAVAPGSSATAAGGWTPPVVEALVRQIAAMGGDVSAFVPALVAARLPEIPQWWFAFQSQGASGGPWTGPTVESTLDSIAASGVKTLILQPIGFLCDHVEILYDVDILFRGYAANLGLRLERPPSLNASHTLARTVADAIEGANRWSAVSSA